MIHPHEQVKYYTPDELAESVTGISENLSYKLWSEIMPAVKSKPLGGDGSNNTIESPELTEEDESVFAAWHLFTDAEKREINHALENLYPDTDPRMEAELSQQMIDNDGEGITNPMDTEK